MKLKKGLALLLSAVLMMTALAACGDKKDSEGSNGIESSGVESSSVESSSVVESDSGSDDNGSDGWYFLGDKVSTYWFDFTVEDAYVCDEYEGYTPESGYRLLVASMTLKNQSGSSVPMYQEDFPVLWGYGDDMDIAYPISAFTDEQLPDEYNLGINRSKSGLLVYEVPEDEVDFSIAFMEIFDDDTEGETYFVDFTPDEK